MPKPTRALQRVFTAAGYLVAVSALAVGCGLAGRPAGLWHPVALAAVVLSAVGYLFCCLPLPAVRRLFDRPAEADVEGAAGRLIELSRGYRSHGERWLEHQANGASGLLEGLGLRLLSAETEPPALEAVLRQAAAELEAIDRQPTEGWQRLAEGAVNGGVILTLSGMVQSLLGPAEAMAPALAGALLATGYGVALAQLVCAPQMLLRRRALRLRAAERELWIDGLLLLQQRLHPRLVAERLQAHRALGMLARAA